MLQQTQSLTLLKPPAVHSSNAPDAFVTVLRSPWYGLVADLYDVVERTTGHYARSKGLKNLPFPLTTRTVTCPNAFGSDSEPVPVTVLGVDTFLPDSMQFALEYGCRLSPGGCYSILPSYRGETPDETHLNQYTHSEAEVPGSLDDMISYVDGYVKALATAVLDEHGDRIARLRGTTAHVERMAARGAPFERITFDQAVRIVGDVDGCVRDEGSWRSLTRKGERLLMQRVDEFVWVDHFDLLSVPFYQAFGDDAGRTARNADLFFGLGETVGGGERHSDIELLRKSMALHDVNEQEYAWYVRMRKDLPMVTSGFGMGIERFLMWVLSHDDIRDIPLMSRLNEHPAFPDAVTRP
ncbi:amino acid--tRNA ligase-related protein [Streptomyces roseochromogenus]|uniref:Aminoacyl-transfer RNA synthetases class-II family profile domain-containing protein n=1 Tax=Streptomyces roseochromogenus subsp. oscitans DS 12.976 TaxID=1352936 RepID=V6JUX9_STRRC|nr:amino acid--tRNA ligase-related protein [Streptomyces roseochromogenus]EST22936.1 hypothetical protein M878_34065 [Streptomyces roseochromogenus subsp. oscitans DS 12.976]